MWEDKVAVGEEEAMVYQSSINCHNDSYDNLK